MGLNMENEDELIKTMKDIKSDVALIAICVLLVTFLIIVDLLLSMIP